MLGFISKFHWALEGNEIIDLALHWLARSGS